MANGRKVILGGAVPITFAVNLLPYPSVMFEVSGLPYPSDRFTGSSNRSSAIRYLVTLFSR